MRKSCPSSDHPGFENASANPPNQLLPMSVQVIVVDQSSTAAARGAASSSNTSTPAEALSPSTSYPSPATIDALTRASASSSSSFAVATLSRASAEPAAKVADEGGAPDSTLPASDTETDTVSAAAVAPVRRSTNAAAAPSVTGVDRRRDGDRGQRRRRAVLHFCGRERGYAVARRILKRHRLRVLGHGIIHRHRLLRRHRRRQRKKGRAARYGSVCKVRLGW